MGAYWGSRWFAVLDDPKTARVEQVDLKPVGVVGTSDRLICPAPPELKCFASYESEVDAVAAVKKHILTETESKILALVCAIEMAKLDIEERRILRDQSVHGHKRDADNRRKIEKWTEELKELRQLRRAKVKVR